MFRAHRCKISFFYAVLTSDCARKMKRASFGVIGILNLMQSFLLYLCAITAALLSVFTVGTEETDGGGMMKGLHINRREQ